jgi:hypothetical protein
MGPPVDYLFRRHSSKGNGRIVFSEPDRSLKTFRRSTDDVCPHTEVHPVELGARPASGGQRRRKTLTGELCPEFARERTKGDARKPVRRNLPFASRANKQVSTAHPGSLKSQPARQLKKARRAKTASAKTGSFPHPTFGSPTAPVRPRFRNRVPTPRRPPE